MGVGEWVGAAVQWLAKRGQSRRGGSRCDRKSQSDVRARRVENQRNCEQEDEQSLTVPSSSPRRQRRMREAVLCLVRGVGLVEEETTEKSVIIGCGRREDEMAK